MSGGSPIAGESITGSAARDPVFDDHINNRYGPFEIGRYSIRAADALSAELDTYAEARREWLEDKRHALDTRICNDAPFPIAACYRDFLQGAENDSQRLGFLKDTWEATISVLMALVLGEFRATGQVVEDVGIKREWLASQTIRERIEVLSRCLGFAQSDLFSTGIISEAAIERLLRLNALRNRVMHSGTLAEQEAADLIGETEPQVVALLEDILGICDFVLLRPRADKFQRFVGHSSRVDLKPLTLSKAASRTLLEHDRNDYDVFALCRQGELIFSLAPYIVYRASARGRHSELAYLKTKKGSGDAMIFQYEVFGEAKPFEMTDPALRARLDEVKAMFVTTKQRKSR